MLAHTSRPRYRDDCRKRRESLVLTFSDGADGDRGFSTVCERKANVGPGRSGPTNRKHRMRNVVDGERRPVEGITYLTVYVQFKKKFFSFH